MELTHPDGLMGGDGVGQGIGHHEGLAISPSAWTHSSAKTAGHAGRTGLREKAAHAEP